jgi:hypothetical protein
MKKDIYVVFAEYKINLKPIVSIYEKYEEYINC